MVVCYTLYVEMYECMEMPKFPYVQVGGVNYELTISALWEANTFFDVSFLSD